MKTRVQGSGVFVNITENGMIGMWVCVKIRQND